jgi:hypothetical protein
MRWAGHAAYMGEACIGVWVGKLIMERSLGGLDVGGQDNVKWIMGWINPAQNRDQWWALVNTAMNLRFHKMLGISGAAEQLLASQEGPSSLGLLSYGTPVL